jgi:SAM-dependent methyltransferase
MSSEVEFKKYHEYLLTRSRLGHLYRNYILYPKIAKNLQGKAVDIGCGIGDFCIFRKDTTGIDINPFNVNYCKQLGLKEVYTIENNFPLPDEGFDSALLDNVLEHLENPTQLISEVHRILKSHGRFVVGVPGIKGYASDPDHKVFYDLNKMKLLIEPLGFRFHHSFNMPVNLKFLSKKIRQFCLYGVFIKS